MRRRLTQWLAAVLANAAQWLRGEQLESFFVEMITKRINTLSPDEALRLLFRLQAALYPTLGRKAVEYGGGTHTKHRHTRYHDFFTSRIQAGERVIDIGCGIGAVAFDIAERSGAWIVGVDLSAENIDMARKRFQHPRVEYRVQDGLGTSPDGQFDVVVLSNILEHLPDRPAFLRQVQRAARPSRILIRVPLFERDWQVPLKRELGVEWRLDPTHETEYTLESFAEEIRQAGCRILHQEIRWGEIWAEVCTA
ncbi:MAG: class I SAM-dependent methyltransferase [Nitrospiraceae bacterium]